MYKQILNNYCKLDILLKVGAEQRCYSHTLVKKRLQRAISLLLAKAVMVLVLCTSSNCNLPLLLIFQFSIQPVVFLKSCSGQGQLQESDKTSENNDTSAGWITCPTLSSRHHK